MLPNVLVVEHRLTLKKIKNNKEKIDIIKCLYAKLLCLFFYTNSNLNATTPNSFSSSGV